MQIVYLPTADDDLVDIYEWIATDNRNAAVRYIDKIRSSLWRLQDYPESGPPREDIAPGARSMTIASHIALYRVGDVVEIVRVVHGARNLAAFAADFA